jgi:putative membrane protein
MKAHSSRALPFLGAALFLAGSTVACKSKDQSMPADTAAVRTSSPGQVDSAAMTPATTTPVAPPNYSNAATISFAHAANDGEITLGKLAEKKATSKDVMAYAKMMVTDHSAMLADTKKLAAKTNTMTDSTIDDVRKLMNHSTDEMKELSDKAAGPDWDKNYMDKAVSDHKDVLDHLQNAQKNTTDADITAALTGAIAKVQMHLTKAQDLRAKL